MTLYALKPRFQALLRPRVERLAAAGVTANQVTLAAMALSLAVGGFVAWVGPAFRPVFLLLPGWLFLRMALNAVDGMLAREFGQKSDLGAYLNELSDVVSDAALVLPFALLPAFGGPWTVAVVVLAAVSEHAGAMGPMIGASRRYDGPFGKSDRAFFFGALATVVALFGSDWSVLAWVMPLAALLTALTIWNRIRKGCAEAGAGSP